MNTVNLFVYGTLMSDQRNNHLLRDGVKLCDAVTPGQLWSIADMYPGLWAHKCVERVRPWKIVHGEVWEAHQSILPDLDHFEGDDYERVRVTTYPVNKHPRVLTCYTYCYVGPLDKCNVIVGGNWREYKQGVS